MLNLNTASVLLAKIFISDVRKIGGLDSSGKPQANTSYKFAVINDAYNVLKEYDFKEVKDKLVNYDEEKTSFYNISNFLGVKVSDKRSSEELLTLGRFYLHPALQETPKKSPSVFDEELNDFVKVQKDDFYLEIIESFTIDDLLMYFYNRHDIEPLKGTSHKTQMANLARDYPLDMILYLIDASVMSAYEEDFTRQPARSPAFLDGFMKEAKELLAKRKNILTEGGLTKIVPRKLYE